MRSILASILILLSMVAAPADLLSHRDFAARMIETVASMEPSLEGEIAGDLEISWSVDGEHVFTSFLDNAYQLYTEDPDALADVLQRYAGVSVERLSTRESSAQRENVVPVIKNRAYIDEVAAILEAQGAATAGFPLHYQTLNAELVILYANDSPNSLAYVGREELEEAGVPLEEALEIATENLAERLPSLEVHGDESLSMLSAGGNFEASLLLFDGIWTPENFPVNGRIVVYVPARDVVLVTGSEDTEGQQRAREMVMGSEWTYPVSDVPFVRTEDGWEVYRPASAP